VGVSPRVIAYCETESQQPPGALLADLGTALKLSADELLGLKAIAEKRSPKRARLLKRLQKVEDLAPADQRAVFKMVEALAHAQQRHRR
jgi:hypothetical protein